MTWRELFRGVGLLVFVVGISACAGISVHKAKQDDADGIRVIPSTTYLFVNGDTGTTQVVQALDPSAAYDIKGWQFLAKNDFTTKFADGGGLTQVEGNMDSTAALTFFQSAFDKLTGLGVDALKAAAGVGAKTVSTENLTGTFGLATGIYKFTYEGGLQRLSP
jgi:hypothetical protein